MPGLNVLAVIFVGCIISLNECRTTVSHKKREWPIKLCVSDDDCNGGCCKGLFCFRYLSEGERCLFGHRLKVGCGCEESLECEKKALPWDHTCTKKSGIVEEEEEEIITTPQPLEVLNRELENFIENERNDDRNTFFGEDEEGKGTKKEIHHSVNAIKKETTVNSTDAFKF